MVNVEIAESMTDDEVVFVHYSHIANACMATIPDAQDEFYLRLARRHRRQIRQDARSRSGKIYAATAREIIKKIGYPCDILSV